MEPADGLMRCRRDVRAQSYAIGRGFSKGLATTGASRHVCHRTGDDDWWRTAGLPGVALLSAFRLTSTGGGGGGWLCMLALFDTARMSRVRDAIRTCGQ
jgi:hypothetical protein